MLFVLVTLSTAAVVVFLNHKPNKPKPGTIATTEENMALTNLMNATMGVDNYKGQIKLTSTDGTVDLSGSFSVLDLSNNARADVTISGAAFGKSINLEVKYKSDYIYATYGNFGLKIKAADLTDEEFLNEIIGLVSKFVNTDTNINFDVDKIMQDLAEIKVEDTKDGHKLSFSLTGLGDVVILTDADYLPVYIDAPAINLLGKTFNIYVEGQHGAAAEVMVSENEEQNYIDVSASKEMITGIIKTIKQTPFTVVGQVNLLGQPINVSFIVDSETNISGSLTLGGATNINIDLVFFDGEVFVNACGAKLKGSLNELIYLFGAYFDADINALLSSLSLGKTSMSIAGVDFNFTLENGYLSSASFEHALANGTLAIANTLPAKVKKPVGYENVLTFTQAKAIVESYTSIINSDKISFSANGSISNNPLNFGVNGFIKLNKSGVEGAFVGGSALGKSVCAWYRDQKAYISFESNRICFTTQFASEVIEKIITIVGGTMPNIKTDVLINMALGEVESLSIDNDGTITLTLFSGITAELRTKSNCKEFKVVGKFHGIPVDCTFVLYNLTTKYEGSYNTLRPDVYEDVSAYSNIVEAFVNTVADGKTEFEGSIDINLLGLIKYQIGISFEVTRDGKDFSFVLKLTNLPSTALITKTTILKHASQSVVLSYSNGKLSAKRYGQKKKGSDLLFQKTYKLQEITTNDIFDIFGIGGTFGSKVKEAVEAAKNNTKQTLVRKNINSLVKLNHIQNGIFVELCNSALPDALVLANVSIKTQNGRLSTISANLATEGYYVIVNAYLNRV